MSDPILVPLADLIFDRDPLKVDDETVASIADSFRETGQQFHEIHVTGDGQKFRLRAGLHRTLAAERVGWTELRALVHPFETETDQLKVELVEIDENLARKKLSPATEADLTARRKAIYERLHPEAKPGGDRASGQNGHLPDSFADAQSGSTGKSSRSVRRAARRGEQIPDVSRVKGTSLDKGEELDALIELREADSVSCETLIERAIAGEKVSAKAELKRITRNRKQQALGAKQRGLPDVKAGVIYADPPWAFKVRSENGMDRSAENHYPTMTLDDIKALGVEDIAADDACCFLWVTNPFLLEGMAVLKAWGFEYVANFAWVKDKQGTGYWNREMHELLLVGRRGNIMAPAPGQQAPSVIDARRGRHSEKPDTAYEIIESYFRDLPKIELFARKVREGWLPPFGNEAPETPPAGFSPSVQDDGEGKEADAARGPVGGPGDNAPQASEVVAATGAGEGAPTPVDPVPVPDDGYPRLPESAGTEAETGQSPAHLSEAASGSDAASAIQLGHEDRAPDPFAALNLGAAKPKPRLPVRP